MSDTRNRSDLRDALESAAGCVKQEMVELAGEVEHALDDVARRLRSSKTGRSAIRERRLARLGERFLALIEAGNGAGASNDPDVLRMVAELRRDSTAEDAG